jgi:hypothetical protein
MQMLASLPDGIAMEVVPGETIVGGPTEPRHWQRSPKLAAEPCLLLPCDIPIRRVEVDRRFRSKSGMAVGGHTRVIVENHDQ